MEEVAVLVEGVCTVMEEAGLVLELLGLLLLDMGQVAEEVAVTLLEEMDRQDSCRCFAGRLILLIRRLPWLAM